MKRILLAIGLTVVGAASWSAASHGQALAKKPVTKYVDMKDQGAVEGEFLYAPKSLTVHLGTKVTWRNKSSQPHTVTDTATHPYFDSKLGKLIQPGKSWAFTFKKTGTFTYYCLIHPDMKGKIVVKR